MSEYSKEWQEEFDRYRKDTTEEMRREYPNWSISYWGHYDPMPYSLFQATRYSLYGDWAWKEFSNLPDIPGYMKLDMVHMGNHNESGFVLDITTDPDDEHWAL